MFLAPTMSECNKIKQVWLQDVGIRCLHHLWVAQWTVTQPILTEQQMAFVYPHQISKFFGKSRIQTP